MANTNTVDPYAKYRVNPNAQATKPVGQEEDPYAKYRVNPNKDSSTSEEEPDDELSFDTGYQEIDPQYKIPEEMFSNVSKETGEKLFNPDKYSIRNDVYVPQGVEPKEEDPNSRPIVDPEAQAQAQAARESDQQNSAIADEQLPMNTQREYASQDARHGVEPVHYTMYDGMNMEQANTRFEQYSKHPDAVKWTNPNGEEAVQYQGRLVPRPEDDGTGKATVGLNTKVETGIAEGTGEFIKSIAALTDQAIALGSANNSMPPANATEEEVAAWSANRKATENADTLTKLAEQIAVKSPESHKFFDKMVTVIANAAPALALTSWIKLGTTAKAGSEPISIVINESREEMAGFVAKSIALLKKSAAFLNNTVAKPALRNLPDAVSVSMATPEKPMGDGFWWEDLPDDIPESQKIVSEKMRFITESLVMSGILGTGVTAAKAAAFSFSYVSKLYSPVRSEQALRKALGTAINDALRIPNSKESLEALLAIYRNPEFKDVVIQQSEEFGEEAIKFQRPTMQVLNKGVSNPLDQPGVRNPDIFNVDGQTGPRAQSLNKKMLAGNTPNLARTTTQGSENVFGALNRSSDNLGGTLSTDLTAEKAQAVATQRLLAPEQAITALEGKKAVAEEGLVNSIKRNPVGKIISDVLQKYDKTINTNASTEGIQKSTESKIRKVLTKVYTDHKEAYNKLADLKDELDNPVLADKGSLDKLLESTNKTSGRTILEDLEATAPDIAAILKRGSTGEPPALSKATAKEQFEALFKKGGTPPEEALEEGLSYSTLLKEVIPKISDKLRGLNKNPAGMKQETVDALLALRTEIYDTQLEVLSKNKAISKKQIKDVEFARTNFKENVLPLSDPRIDIGRAYLENRDSLIANAKRAADDLLPAPEAVANAAAKDVASNVNTLNPLERPNGEWLKGQTKVVKDSVVKFQVASKVLSLLKDGKNVVDLPDVVDEKFLKKNFGDVAAVMGQVAPKTLENFNKLLKEVKSGKLGIEALEQELKTAREALGPEQEKVYSNAISKYFFEGGDPKGTKLSDGYNAIKDVFEAQNTNSVKEVIEAIKENGDETAMNGLKAAYYRYVRGKVFQSTGEGKVLNGEEVAKFFSKDAGKTNREMRDLIFKDAPNSSQFIEESLEYLNEVQRFSAKGTVVSAGDVSSTTVVNDIKDQTRIGLNAIFGPLDPTATAVNSALKVALKFGHVKQRTENMLDLYMSDPKYAEETIELMLKDFKDPSLFKQLGGIRRIVKNAGILYALTPSEQEVLQRDLEAQMSKPRGKVPDAVKNLK